MVKPELAAVEEPVPVPLPVLDEPPQDANKTIQQMKAAKPLKGNVVLVAQILRMPLVKKQDMMILSECQAGFSSWGNS